MDDNNKEKLNNNLENKNEENEKNIKNNNENNSNTTNNIIITEEPKNTENNLEPLKNFEINSKKEEETRKEENEKKVEELKMLNNIKIDNEKENENLNINEIKKEMKKVEETKEPIKIKEMDKNKKNRLMARMMSSQLLSKKKVKLEKKTSEAILKRARKLDSNFNKPEIRKFNPYSEAVKNKNFGIEDNEILQVTEIETKITQPIGPKKIDLAAFMKK